MVRIHAPGAVHPARSAAPRRDECWCPAGRAPTVGRPRPTAFSRASPSVGPGGPKRSHRAYQPSDMAGNAVFSFRARAPRSVASPRQNRLTAANRWYPEAHCCWGWSSVFSQTATWVGRWPHVSTYDQVPRRFVGTTYSSRLSDGLPESISAPPGVSARMPLLPSVVHPFC